MEDGGDRGDVIWGCWGDNWGLLYVVVEEVWWGLLLGSDGGDWNEGM